MCPMLLCLEPEMLMRRSFGENVIEAEQRGADF